MTCRSLIDMGRRRRDLGEGLTEITIFLIYGNIDQGQPLVDLWRFSEFPDDARLAFLPSERILPKKHNHLNIA